MNDIKIRIDGVAGRITLDRPDALNALSHDMCRAISAALKDWRENPAVQLVILDATGDKAFCAGGDIQQMYDTGKAGDFDYGRQFWRDEYQMNLALASFPKPIVSLMQGFTLGGGIGVGCHASHRIVCDSSRMALPEVCLGLVPDVGSTWLLCQAPGYIGEFLGATAARMGPGDAILAGFADHYMPRGRWSDLIRALTHGRIDALSEMAEPSPALAILAAPDWINRVFSAPNLDGIITALAAEDTDRTRKTSTALAQNSPLAMTAAIDLIRSLRRTGGGVAQALKQEYRFAARAMEHGDFIEGIRAAIIDKDRNPTWRHDHGAAVLPAEVAQMLSPLGNQDLKFEEEQA